MPQINRIRVNNVKYNFGTQFYDDFLMRFSCKNTIYDLANGGGKSVLMLLLLQTVIPNCTLDDKQPVEKLFRTNSGSTTIHSMVEWKLDACDVKNGYRYMTCGFCARKGRENDEEGGSNTDSASIDYFNYCIFYREFGDNDIKNLPLVNGNERITYNGLKNYLKDLERKDFNVQVKIFEKKSDYQSFINNYGIYESQWEIVRGINKTEGHVRTYFESSYKTTRKVVEDLLVEEIIEKSYNNRIRNGNADDEMAKTLLDIKDKLLELARRKEDIGSYERQIELLRDFSGRIESFSIVYSKKEALKTAMLTYLAKAKAKVRRQEQQAEAIRNELDSIKEAIRQEEKLIAIADIEEEKVELVGLRLLVDELSDELNGMARTRDAYKQELMLAETAIDYEEYSEHRKKHAEIKEYIENRHKDRSDLTGELKALATAKKAYTDKALMALEAELEELVKALAESEKAVEAYEADSRNNDNQRAKAEGVANHLSSQIAELEETIKSKMAGGSLLVSDRAYEEARSVSSAIEKLNIKKNNLVHESEELKEKQEYCMKELALTDAKLTLLAESIDRFNNELANEKAEEEQIGSLGRVYGETQVQRLLNVVERIHDEMLSDREALNTRHKQLESFITDIKDGRLTGSSNMDELFEYLEARYSGQVMRGSTYISDKKPEEAAELIKEYPYLPYSIIVKEDYELIINDRNVTAFDSLGVVPVINEAVLASEIGIESENYFLACRDMSFIYDEAGKNAGLKRLKEEEERVSAELAKVRDRLSVVKKDFELINAYVHSQGADAAELEEKLTAARKEYKTLEEKKRNLYALKESVAERINDLKVRQADNEKQLAETENNLTVLVEIGGLNDKLNECLAGLTEAKQLMETAVKGKKLADEILQTKKKQYSDLLLRRKHTEDELEAVKRRWEQDYLPYYTEGEAFAGELSEEELDARFDALRQLIGNELGDLADKERLMENYHTNMERIKRAMEYRGVTFEEAATLYSEGQLAKRSYQEMVELRNKQKAVVSEMEEKESSLNAVSAQMNRVEGSVAHAERSVAEKYGEPEEITISNPGAFRMEHKNELNHKNELLKAAALKEKENARLFNGYMLMQKDLERIIKSMDIDPDSIAADTSIEDTEIAVKEYEEASKAFERILKDENRKREDFLKEKDMLVSTLAGLNAFELAEELKRSIYVPADMEEAAALMTGLNETNECIALERDRISRGIEDMELIKDNFENRCIQICTNIKAELERLPKLSRITMDDEVIPILSLQIPYIKEDMYKDRMSVYINETVASAENFNTVEEKLKYIKSRLTWKRLFSVIVTDMNSIRLNLYKRERIKDQSRYLRYEEAVGSTGQSQGIYIQFLVAIINYIANINAGGKEASILGKTIFIDNPFGAAKDVYIWEPIFKLLKTNHVQLIVPARGATPAITGRFDVNYVLGQKLVGNKQQTVVVDYRSQVTESELEYVKLNFSQESFDFL